MSEMAGFCKFEYSTTNFFTKERKNYINVPNYDTVAISVEEVLSFWVSSQDYWLTSVGLG